MTETQQQPDLNQPRVITVLDITGLSKLEIIKILGEYSKQNEEQNGPISFERIEEAYDKFSLVSQLIDVQPDLKDKFEYSIAELTDGLLVSFAAFGYGVIREENSITLQTPNASDRGLVTIMHKAIGMKFMMGELMASLSELPKNKEGSEESTNEDEVDYTKIPFKA